MSAYALDGRRRVLKAGWSAGLLMAAPAALAQSSGEEAPIIAAASDLKFVLETLADAFAQQTGQALRLVFGASGLLTTQLRQGAPFELFMSADEAYIRGLAAQGLVRDIGAVYAVGHLALAVPRSSRIQLDSNLNGLRAAVSAGLIRRFAMANPDHAPYGRRAREVFEHLRLWVPLKGRLVLGENVAQAAQFALSGSTDGGLIAESHARVPGFAARGRSVVVSGAFHSPLIQRMALTPRAGRTTERFFQYLQTAQAREVFSRFGFGSPEGLG